MASGTPFVHMTHPGIDGETLVPDDASVVEAFEAKGWIRSEGIPEHLDPDAPNTGATVTGGPADVPAGGPPDEPPVDPVDAVDTADQEPAPKTGRAPRTSAPTTAPAAGDDTTGE